MTKQFVSSTIVLFVLFCSPTVDAQSKSCKSPDGIAGKCVPIRECQTIVQLLPIAISNSTVGNYIRSSACGTNHAGPLICCTVGSTLQRITDEPADVSKIGQCGNRSIDDLDFRPGRWPWTENLGYRGRWPWLAALGYRGDKPDDKPSWLCGGALITSNFILTAAHCVVRSGLYVVRLGEVNFDIGHDSAVDIEISRTFAHEYYDRRTHTSDIALLLLKHAAPYNIHIYPICLPYDVQDDELKFGSVAGWGALEFDGNRSQTLQEVRVPFVKEDRCRKAYAAVPEQIIDKLVVCAGYEKDGKDVCSGDSGGPLMWSRRTEDSEAENAPFYVVGVVSFGYRCAEPDYPGVFTRVSEFLPWIRSKILQVK